MQGRVWYRNTFNKVRLNRKTHSQNKRPAYFLSAQVTETCRNHANNLFASMRRCPWGAAVSLCVYNAFWHHFPYFLHHFFGHRFCIDFVSTFHAFLSAQNHVFYCKTNSFEHFSLFQKSLKNYWFGYPFWYHFWSLLALIFNTFSTLIFACLFWCLFSDFRRKWSPNGAPP